MPLFLETRDMIKSHLCAHVYTFGGWPTNSCLAPHLGPTDRQEEAEQEEEHNHATEE